MPRIEFGTLEEARNWIVEKVIDSKKDYDAYFTKKKELILLPNKSTRPILSGYVKFAKKTDIDKLFPTTFKIYSCLRFEWDSQHTITKEND